MWKQAVLVKKVVLLKARQGSKRVIFGHVNPGFVLAEGAWCHHLDCQEQTALASGKSAWYVIEKGCEKTNPARNLQRSGFTLSNLVKLYWCPLLWALSLSLSLTESVETQREGAERPSAMCCLSCVGGARKGAGECLRHHRQGSAVRSFLCADWSVGVKSSHGSGLWMPSLHGGPTTALVRDPIQATTQEALGRGKVRTLSLTGLLESCDRVRLLKLDRMQWFFIQCVWELISRLISWHETL